MFTEPVVMALYNRPDTDKPKKVILVSVATVSQVLSNEATYVSI